MSNILKEIIKEIKLKNKTILDLASEHAEATCILADQINEAGLAGRIISINKYSAGKKELLKKLGKLKKIVDIKTRDPEKLSFLNNKSIDIIFSYKTISDISRNAFVLYNALKEFSRILKTGGKLIIINEYPLTKIKKDHDIVYASRTNLQKAISLLIGEIAPQEIYPQDLMDALKEIGFKNTKQINVKRKEINIEDMNEWYEKILKKLSYISNDRLRDAFLGEVENIKRLFYHKGGLTTSYYIVEAQN